MNEPFILKSDREQIRRTAEISECGQYRWSLRRSWYEGDGRVVCFVMLNPSTADGTEDDPTIRRCIGFAKKWGYSVLSVRNLFPYRATNPTDLKAANYPTGGDRGDIELLAARSAHTTVCAWGTKAPQWRVNQAAELLTPGKLHCLETTRNGDPRHPLYLPADTELVPFNFS